MLIALANPGGDFTVTLFAPKADFAELTDAAAVDGFFTTEFPDFAAMVSDLTDQFANNPTGPLGTLRTDGWSHDDRAIVIGDAAHAIVPFHGQGMNAAMESARAGMWYGSSDARLARAQLRECAPRHASAEAAAPEPGSE